MASIIADHGHNVTIFQPYHAALKNIDGLVANKNVEIIHYYPDHYEELLKIPIPTFPEFWDSHLLNNPILQAFMQPRALGDAYEKTATQLLKDEKLHQTLKEKKFDVAIVETFEITGFYFARLLDLPSIPVISTVRFYDYLFGQPSILGYIPNIGSKMVPEAGFLDRLNDIYRTFFLNILLDGMCQYQMGFIEKALGPVPGWKELITQSPVYITNSNSYLDFAVPTTAAIVHIGGMTTNLEKMKKSVLPEEYKKILEERGATVLISFGSVIRSFEMPDNFKAGLIATFKSLPNVTFIWKYEKEDVEFQKSLPENVYLKKWVPQPALLSDKRVKLFVTHGGLHSVMEAAYSGKPALVVPIFGDQFQNADMLARHGGAVAFEKFGLGEGKKLTETVRDMVENQKYEENAEILKNVLHNQPIDPKMNLMKHLEFAIRFPNLRSQVPAINQVGLVAHYYLDVILFLGILFLIILFVTFQLFRKIVSKFIVKKVKNE